MDNNSKFIIDYNDEGKRLDAYLSEMLVDISRSKIQSAIKKSEILVNSKGTKPSYQLRENDVIECGNFEAELHNIPPQKSGDVFATIISRFLSYHILLSRFRLCNHIREV